MKLNEGFLNSMHEAMTLLRTRGAAEATEVIQRALRGEASGAPSETVPQDETATLAMIRSTAPEAEDRYFAGQISSRLESALDRLSARQRAVFTLRHYDDLSLEEIGQLLGLDVGTVKAHMFRAVSKLRGELRDLYEGSR